MADRPADRPAGRRSVQDFVRNVINAVTNLQTRSSQRANNEESSRAEFESITEEVNAQFQIPRQVSRGRRTATATTSTIVPATSFNPRQNYTFQQTRRYPRGGARNSSSTSRVEQPDLYSLYKDICLLPNPEYDHVPRGAAKANLVQRGLYVDAFKLDKTWSEARLYVELASMFKEALNRPGLDDIG